jgi:hypothetical protein
MSDAIATPVRTSDTTSPAGDCRALASGGPDVTAAITTIAPAEKAVVPDPERVITLLAVAPDVGAARYAVPVCATLLVAPSFAPFVHDAE